MFKPAPLPCILHPRQDPDGKDFPVMFSARDRYNGCPKKAGLKKFGFRNATGHLKKKLPAPPPPSRKQGVVVLTSEGRVQVGNEHPV